ncbi:MAG: ATP-binding protein [Persicimonas sp.]
MQREHAAKEAEILPSEGSWLESLMKAMPHGVSFHDGEGRWLLANEKTLSFFGLDDVDYRGKTSDELARASENYRDFHWECRRTDKLVWERGQACSFELEVAARNGTLRTLELTKVPLFEEDGSRRGMLVLARDITERRRFERLKAEFVSVIGHELRSPLTPISGVLSLLAGEAVRLPARIQQMVELALKNSERLMRLIDELLDVQKVADFDSEFSVRRLQLSQVVAKAIGSNRALEYYNGIEVDFVDEAPEAVVEADENRLIQVVTNLLSNAARFSPSDSSIEIRLERSDPDTVCLSVRDEGPGIPEEFQPFVFESFARAELGSPSERRGSGLALTIARLIVERLGGDIDFESSPEEGTTFYVELPTVD